MAPGDKPPLDSGRGGGRNRHCKKGKALGFPAFPGVASKICTLCSACFSEEGGCSAVEECWPSEANSRLLQARISPWSLAPRYLFSLNRCHQRCWALWSAASRAGPSNDTSRCASDIHAISHGVLSCGGRYSKVGRRSLADLVLLPAAATDFVRGEEKKKNPTPSLWLFCLLQIEILRHREMKQLKGYPSKTQSCHQVRVSGKPRLEGVLQPVENSGWVKILVLCFIN